VKLVMMMMYADVGAAERPAAARPPSAMHVDTSTGTTTDPEAPR